MYVASRSIGCSGFQQFPTIASWLNVAGMVCCGTLLLSYLVLPVERTSRHYLTVGLVLAICLIQVCRERRKKMAYNGDG